MQHAGIHKNYFKTNLNLYDDTQKLIVAVYNEPEKYESVYPIRDKDVGIMRAPIIPVTAKNNLLFIG